jgi:hypothetical protein
MLGAKEVKNTVCDCPVTALSLEQLIMSAQVNHINYVFIDKNLVSSDLIDNLRDLGYTLVIGQGEISRIKISW